MEYTPMLKIGALLLVVSTMGCAAKKCPPIPPPPPPQESLVERQASCKATIEHMVDLAVDEYIEENVGGTPPTKAEKAELRAHLVEVLDDRGTLTRFNYKCLSDMSIEHIACIKKATVIQQAIDCK